ncbi:MAG: ABC transporter permease [Calditrichaeota bacterium]|nr:MAG: ABC transporter permease [Calditrichota bacterium]
MLWKIAWRNIWRNKRRSLIVLTSIIVGLVAIVLYDSLSVGMIYQMLENQIGSYVAHIQIHKNGFNDNRIIQNYVPSPHKVDSLLQKEKFVKAYSKRVLSFGILSSATNSSGVYLVGIRPEMESRVTKIHTYITEGTYLTGKSHEIVIGKNLADKLKVGIGDKVVAMASSLHGNIGAEVFRVVGIYQSFSSQFDKIYIYVNLHDAQNMLELEDNISEFALLLENSELSQNVKNRLSTQLGEEYEVLTFQELLPMLVLQIDVYKESIFIFYAIIAIAMIFGIVNTMLMSVFERIQEFGVLMAIGMKNSRVFFMVLLEALILGTVGTIVGFILGYLIYIPLSHTGIDFAMFSEGLKAFGVGTVIYPVLTLQSVVSALLVIPFISVIGAIYPAIKAIRLEPINAIRYV